MNMQQQLLDIGFTISSTINNLRNSLLFENQENRVFVPLDLIIKFYAKDYTPLLLDVIFINIPSFYTRVDFII